MAHVTNVTLSVTFHPERFPLRWAESGEEVPAWDMSRGVNPAHTRWLSDVWLEDLEAMTEAQRRAEMRQIVRKLLALNFSGALPLSAYDFPRLVRAWAGPSRRNPPVREVEAEGRGVLRELPISKPAFDAVLGLFPLLAHGGAEKRERLLAGILETARDYSLLNPLGGDTLADWLEVICQVKFVDRLTGVIHRQGGLVGDVTTLLGEAETWVLQRSRAYRHDGAVVGEEFTEHLRGGFVHAFVPKREARNPLNRAFYALAAALLPQQDLRLSLFPARYALRCGLREWIWVEFSQHIGGSPRRFRRCADCGRLLSPRSRKGTKTCGDACRKALSRRLSREESSSGAKKASPKS